MKTALDIFNKVSEHLLDQNHRSLSVADLRCLYRSPTGLKCAVGCLIKDEFYTPRLEGLGVEAVIGQDSIPPVVAALQESGVPVTETVLRLLADLQGLHDYVTPAGWPEGLAQIKNNFFGGEV